MFKGSQIPYGKKMAADQRLTDYVTNILTKQELARDRLKDIDTLPRIGEGVRTTKGEKSDYEKKVESALGLISNKK